MVATEEQRVRVPSTGEQPQGLIVLCAGNNYDTVRVLDQHMADRLARLAPVLYVDPPMSHLSPRNNPQLAASLHEPRLRRTPDGFWRLTPVVTPFPMRRGLSSLTQYLVRRALSRAVGDRSAWMSKRWSAPGHPWTYSASVTSACVSGGLRMTTRRAPTSWASSRDGSQQTSVPASGRAISSSRRLQKLIDA